MDIYKEFCFCMRDNMGDNVKVLVKSYPKTRLSSLGKGLYLPIHLFCAQHNQFLIQSDSGFWIIDSNERKPDLLPGIRQHRWSEVNKPASL